MSVLYLVRHGQASWAAADYDQLSDLGVRQARLLGEWIARTGRKLDAVYAGPLKRQRDTARHLAQAAREAGGGCPDADIAPELAEHPTEDIIKASLETLLAEDPELAAELAAEAADGNFFRSRRPFQRLFERAMLRWARGQLDGKVEPFTQFESRVEGVLARIMREQGRGKTVAVVTSAGPIALALRRVLALTDEVAFRLNLVVANASVTELRWRDDEVMLAGFNGLPHLPTPDLVTHR